MNEWNLSPEFEKKIYDSFGSPEVNPDFKDRLYRNLMQTTSSRPEKKHGKLSLRPAWIISILFISIFLIAAFVVGPQRVIAAVGRLFGYIPGIGIVNDESNFRVLAEPVSLTQDGITLTISDGLLSEEQTVILFSMENIPADAISHAESEAGCMASPELLLPDGNSLQIIRGGGNMTQMRFAYSPVSPDINDLKFVLACLPNTLPGLAPENWEVPLHFIPAPPDFNMLPVIEVELTPTAASFLSDEQEEPLSISKVIEINDNIIIFTEFDPEKTKDISAPEANWQLTGGISLKDGDGKDIFFSSPSPDIDFPEPTQPNNEVFAFQFSKNFTPPLTITYSGIYINKIGTPQHFTFEFDPGENPQPGQEWIINKDFTVDNQTIQLVSISAFQDGYGFIFDQTAPASLFTENTHFITPEMVEIKGFTAMGGGGGTNTLSLMYQDLPKGNLTVEISLQHYQSLRAKTFQTQWSPKMISQPLFGLTLNIDKYIPYENGYYLIGHTQWADERIVNITEYGTMNAFDANGNKLNFSKVPFSEAIAMVDNLEPTQWIYQLEELTLQPPITLHLDLVNIEFASPLRFSFDLRPYGFNFLDNQVGLSWKTGVQALDIPGLPASFFKATYLRDGNYSGFEFALNADPRLTNLALDFENGVSNEHMSRKYAYRFDDEYNLLLATVMTDGQISMPLSMIAYGADISSNWVTTWTP